MGVLDESRGRWCQGSSFHVGSNIKFYPNLEGNVKMSMCANGIVFSYTDESYLALHIHLGKSQVISGSIGLKSIRWNILFTSTLRWYWRLRSQPLRQLLWRPVMSSESSWEDEIMDSWFQNWCFCFVLVLYFLENHMYGIFHLDRLTIIYSSIIFLMGWKFYICF